MDAKTLWQKALSQIETGDLKSAYTTLSAALDIEPDNPDILSERAVVIFHLGDLPRSLTELDKCVVLEPKNPYRYSSRAYIKSNMKMLDEAIEDYEICVELDPDDPIAYNNLGLLLESKGRMEAAKRHFSRAEELEGLLNERGVDLPKVDPNKAIKTESEAAPVEGAVSTEDPNEKTWDVAKEVFTKKSVFKEYWSFITNGFKIKEDNKSE